MAHSLDQFVTQLLASQLVSREELRTILDAYPTDKQPLDGEHLARELVRLKRLTSYQATQIYLGKLQNLTLGSYRILDKLGQGGMGLVLKAEHKLLKRLVAIKVLSPSVTGNPEALQRFQREVETAAKLSHPNIVAAYDADSDHKTRFLVFEYVEGTNLNEYVTKHGPLPAELALKYIHGAAKGLEYAHQQGVIHRDIKPSNLLLDQTGTVRVLDMGLARLIEESSPHTSKQMDLTQTGIIMGTVDFMSPEQAENMKKADPRSDLYSLGICFYYLLTGENPYQGETFLERVLAHREWPIPLIRARRPEIGAEIDALFQRMVAKRPADRFQSMTELIAALARCMFDEVEHRKLVELSSPIPSATRLPERPGSLVLPAIPVRTAAAMPVGASVPVGKVIPLSTAVPVSSAIPVGTAIPVCSPAPACNPLSADAPVPVTEPVSSPKIGWSPVSGIFAKPLIRVSGPKAVRSKVLRNRNLKLIVSGLVTTVAICLVGWSWSGAGTAAGVTRRAKTSSKGAKSQAEDATESTTEPSEKSRKSSDREVADWVLNGRGTIEIEDDRGERQVLENRRSVPKGRFTIRQISLISRDVVNQDIERFVGLKGLESLLMPHNPLLTNECLPSLLKLERMTVLHVAGTGLTVEGLSTIPQLRELGLDAEQLTAGTITATKFSELRRLDLIGLTDPELQLLLKVSIPLESLTLSNSHGSRNTWNSLFGRLAELSEIQIVDCNLSDGDISQLNRCRRLAKVTLTRTRITDSGLKDLARIKSLKYLNVRNTQVTRVGVQKFRNSQPQCEVEA